MLLFKRILTLNSSFGFDCAFLEIPQKLELTEYNLESMESQAKKTLLFLIDTFLLGEFDPKTANKRGREIVAFEQKLAELFLPEVMRAIHEN